MLKYKLESGPYKGRLVILKRKDNMNKMQYVVDASTNEMLLVNLSEISEEPIGQYIQRFKLKIR